MSKYLVLTVFSLIVILGCSSSEEVTALGEVSIGTKLGSSEVSPGLSTTFVATIFNTYPKNLENAQVKLIHSSDLSVPDDIKFGLTIPKGGTTYTLPWQILISDDAIKRDYSMRVQLCFDYASSGFQEIVFNNGESISLPQSGGEIAPVDIIVSGLELPVNTKSVQTAFALVKISDIAGGRIVDSIDDSTEILDIVVEIENTGGLLSVDENQLTGLLEVVPEGDSEYEDGKIRIRTPIDGGFLAIDGNIEFVVPIEISDPTSEEIRTINVGALYTYCVESTPTILTIK